MTAKIVPFRRAKPVVLPRPVAEEAIHRLAHKGKFAPFDEGGFTEKMLANDFTMRQVMETIKEGVVNQGPEMDEYGEWRCRVRRRAAGKSVRVVVAISAILDFLTLLSVH